MIGPFRSRGAGVGWLDIVALMLREETPVATLAWPTLEQQIRLDAFTIDGRLVAKSLVTPRASGIAGALAAQPVEDVPQVLARLFPLCGTAHAIASLAAIEATQGIEAVSYTHLRAHETR